MIRVTVGVDLDICFDEVQARAVLAQKFWGGGIAPICPFITESIFSVL